MAKAQWKKNLLLVVVSIRICNGLVVQSPSNSVRSYLEFLEPETNCKVVLLGCLHGSLSSASDVQMLLKDEKTDVVVLELCASRLADLRNESKQKSNDRQPVIQRFVAMVARTKEKKGFATAIAACVLGGASILQTALSGNKPGLEFTTAMELAEITEGCDLVLADQEVDETLRRMGSLPYISLSMMRDFLTTLDWGKSYGQDARTLRTAIFGDDSMNDSEQVQLGSFLLRNQEVKNDVFRLTIPPLLLAGLTAKVVVLLLNFFVGTAGASEVDVVGLVNGVGLSSQDLTQVVLNEIVELVRSVAILLIGSIILVLPAARVILHERDEYLERGIRTACRLAASKSNGGRVVAVLGLLHVNMLAKRLRGTEGNQ